MEEVISTLRNDDPITELKFIFVDTNFNASQELQDALLANKMSGRLQNLNVSNAFSTKKYTISVLILHLGASRVRTS
jgi:hypothetical protein